MRNPILKPIKSKISYEIREIISKADQLSALGYTIIKENIGDPVLKGHILPQWMKDIVKDASQVDLVYAYCESKGLIDTRRFLAKKTNSHSGYQISPDDITFFNGLGDAIARIYSLLNHKTKVIMPTPTYPAHSSAEISRIGTKPITYKMNPENDWRPDLTDLESKIISHPEISGILIINPDNPTGKVHTEKDLRAIVALAKKYDLFIICDEIYEDMVYSGNMVRLCEVIDDVPALCLKGISKVMPWPGSRCGWIEYYNRNKNDDFNEFCSLLDQHKMTEVCSTTLPQFVIPRIMQHPEFDNYLAEKNHQFANRMNLVIEELTDIEGVRISNTGGAFYAAVTFTDDFWKYDFPTDSIDNSQIKSLLNEWLNGTDRMDLKFVYYLMATEGICMVPLTGFNSGINGLRFTLLENDETRFREIIDGLKRACLKITEPAQYVN